MSTQPTHKTNEELAQNEASHTPHSEHHSRHGVILSILLLALLLFICAAYLVGRTVTKEPTPAPTTLEQTPFDNTQPETPRAAADAHINLVTSPSDEISAIEADIESTNLDSLDAELGTMEAELDAGMQ